MDLQKYEEALQPIEDLIIPKYFNNDKKKYRHAKLMALQRFGDQYYDYFQKPLPVFVPYFRRNFLFFCVNAPNFVGSVLYSTYFTKASDFVDWLKPVAEYYYPPNLRSRIAITVDLYEDVSRSINDIMNNRLLLKNDLDKLLSMITDLDKKIYYRYARFSYTRLLKELRFSLQLLYNMKDIDSFFYYNKNLFANYPDLIHELATLWKRQKTFDKYTLIQMLIEDLISIYARIENVHPIPSDYKLDKKKNPSISDSAIKIKMDPFPGKKSNNVITINNKQINNVQNSPFDLLYYLLWLQINYPDKKAALVIDDIIPVEHINAITENDEQLNRFGYSWNNINNIRFKKYH